MGRQIKTVFAQRLAGGLLVLVLALAACGEAAPAPRPSYEVPTAPPTAASFEGIPDAARIGSSPRPAPPTPPATPGPDRLELSPGAGGEDTSEEGDGVGGPGERGLTDVEATALAKLSGTPGPGYLPGGNQAGATGTRRSGQASRPAPTPTLSTNPKAVRIQSLASTPVSFLGAYRQSALKMLEVNPNARLVFASASLLSPDRTTWSFMFVAAEGPRMWRVIFDSEGNRFDLREVAPGMLEDAKIIDMGKVLDGPQLIERAAASGLNTTLPVDVINFQVEGTTRLPCFIFTNVAQGKQVAIHAYTGQVVRNDF